MRGREIEKYYTIGYNIRYNFHVIHVSDTSLIKPKPLAIPPSLELEEVNYPADQFNNEFSLEYFNNVVEGLILANQGSSLERFISQTLEKGRIDDKKISNYIRNLAPASHRREKVSRRVEWDVEESREGYKESREALIELIRSIHYSQLPGIELEKLTSNYSEKLINQGMIEPLRQICRKFIESALEIKGGNIDALDQERMTIWNLYPSALGFIRANLENLVPNNILNNVSSNDGRDWTVEALEAASEIFANFHKDPEELNEYTPEDIEKLGYIYSLREILFQSTATQLIQALAITLKPATLDEISSLTYADNVRNEINNMLESGVLSSEKVARSTFELQDTLGRPFYGYGTSGFIDQNNNYHKNNGDDQKRLLEFISTILSADELSARIDNRTSTFGKLFPSSDLGDVRAQAHVNTIGLAIDSDKTLQEAEEALSSLEDIFFRINRSFTGKWDKKRVVYDGFTKEELYEISEIAQKVALRYRGRIAKEISSTAPDGSVYQPLQFENGIPLLSRALNYLQHNKDADGNLVDPYQLIVDLQKSYSEIEAYAKEEPDIAFVYYTSMLKAFHAARTSLLKSYDALQPSHAIVDYMLRDGSESLRPNNDFYREIIDMNTRFNLFIEERHPEIKVRIENELSQISSGVHTTFSSELQAEVASLFKGFDSDTISQPKNIEMVELKTNSRSENAKLLLERRMRGLMAALVRSAQPLKVSEESFKNWYFSMNNPFITLGLAGYLNLASTSLFAISYGREQLRTYGERKRKNSTEPVVHVISDMPFVMRYEYLNNIYSVYHEFLKEESEAETIFPMSNEGEYPETIEAS